MNRGRIPLVDAWGTHPRNVNAWWCQLEHMKDSGRSQVHKSIKTGSFWFGMKVWKSRWFILSWAWPCRGRQLVDFCIFSGNPLKQSWTKPFLQNPSWSVTFRSTHKSVDWRLASPSNLFLFQWCVALCNLDTWQKTFCNFPHSNRKRNSNINSLFLQGNKQNNHPPQLGFAP